MYNQTQQADEMGAAAIVSPIHCFISFHVAVAAKAQLLKSTSYLSSYSLNTMLLAALKQTAAQSKWGFSSPRIENNWRKALSFL